MYDRTSFGPGNIGNLTSGIGLTYGPTIGSNDSATVTGAGGSHGAYAIPPVPGLGGCGCSAVRGHAPVPMRGLGGLLGLGVCDEGCQKWVKWGLIGVVVLFGLSYLHDTRKTQY